MAPVVTLKPVGVSDDGSYVVLARRAGAKTGGFRVEVDATLLRRIKQAQRRAAPPPPRAKKRTATAKKQPPTAAAPLVRPTSKLTPKEIQTLLRQGRSVASIAKKAGVDEAWIERFEGPIVWERSGMATRARRATLRRARMGPSGLPLGDAVAANLKRKGIEVAPRLFEDSWDSVRRPRKATWVVSFSFDRRGRTQTAKWEFDPEASNVQSVNALGAQLGWVAGRRRRRSA
ncbi:MAG: septation protein SepH [Actinomycetota bacterium]